MKPSPSSPPSQSTIGSTSMASQTFILWLHGLGDSGPANEPIKAAFNSRQLANARWSFPSAPFQPVTCNHGAVMPSWFDIPEIPLTAIALLEEQKKDSPEEPLDKSVETYPTDEKPDINDVPMEENEVSEDANAGRQVLNESKLDLNAHDADEDGEETEDQER